MTNFQPAFSEIMDKQPTRMDGPEYNQWTVDVKKQAEFKINDPDIARDINTCAMMLYVSFSVT